MDLTKIIPNLSVELNEHSLKALIEDTFKNHIPGYEVSGVHFSVDQDRDMRGEVCGNKVKANVRFSKRVPEDPYTH